MKLSYSLRFFLFFSLAFLTSCNEDIDFENMSLKERTYSVLDSYYYWIEYIPKKIDLSQYLSAQDLINSLRNKEIDRWSYVGFAKDYDIYYEEARYKGFGYGNAIDQDFNLRVSFIYDDSPLKEFGVKRGWKFLSGSPYSGELYRFNFINLQGDTVIIDAPQRIVKINTVLEKNIITTNSQNVGYFAFKNFLEPSRAELDEVFDLFDQNNISELIIDLRYNGGGRVETGRYLAGYVIPPEADGKPFATLIHNEKQKSKNYTMHLAKRGNLNLGRVFFLVSYGTASASEQLISSLKPYLKVITIGSGNTYGKAAGSYAFRHHEYVISPICFKSFNANGEGNYFDGLEPDILRNDDFLHPLGDPEETMLKEALYYIANNHFSEQLFQKSAKTEKENRDLINNFSGFRAELNSY